MKPGDKYYDGPIVETGRTLEEIEEDLKREAEEMKKVTWTPDMLDW